MLIKRRSNHALAFIPALLLFVLLLTFVGSGIIMLAKTAKNALNPPAEDPPYTGPTTNTPPGATSFSTFTEYDEIPTLTPEQIQWLMSTSTNQGEFDVIILRSTNLIDWVEIIRTNTVNKQVLWNDPNPPYPNAFYKPQVVIP